MKSVGIIIFSKDNKKILLAKRSKNAKVAASKWENVGGQLESGETFEQAAIREVNEELGVEVVNLEQKLIYGAENSNSCSKVFKAVIQGTPQIRESSKCEELQWVAIADLNEFDLASYTLKDFQKLGWIEAVGYSSKPLYQKLGLQSGRVSRVINPPQNYFTLLGDLPESIIFTDKAEQFDFIQIFAKSEAEYLASLPEILVKLKKTGMLWVNWPKKASGIQADLNENVIRELTLPTGLVDTKICAIDATWSGLKFVYRLKERRDI